MQIKISSWHIKVLPNCFHFVTSPHQFNKLLHSHIKFKVTLSNKIKIDNSTEPTNKEHKHYMQSKPRVVKKILRHYITYRTNPALSKRFWDITVHYIQSKSRVVRKILRHYCTLHAEQSRVVRKILRHYITCRANPGLSERFWDITVHYMQSNPGLSERFWDITLHAEQIQGCQKDLETLDCATMQATLGIISVMFPFFKLSHKHSE